MSFSICAQIFRSQDFATFDRNIAWKLFEPFARAAPICGWDLYDGDRFFGTLSLDHTPEVDGVGINRPGEKAFELLYELALQAGLLIYWDGRGVVTDPKFIDELPRFLVEAFTWIKVVRNWQQITNSIVNGDPEDDTPLNLTKRR